jgi:putative ABC transport system permease protein
MFTTILKSTFRNLLRNKTFTLLNLLGLALAFTSVIIIYLWVSDELSFDTFHDDVDDIYLVYKEYQVGGGIDQNPSTPFPLGNALVQEIPEVIQSTKFVRGGSNIRKGEKIISESGFTLCDSAFFKIFTFKFLEGDINTCLVNKNSVVLTKKMAEKYFGNQPAFNKELEIDGDMTVVTGIVEPISKNSVANFDFFMSIENTTRPSDATNWLSHWLFTYVKTIPNADKDNIYKKIDEFSFDKLENRRTVFRFQNIVDTNLYTLNGKPAKLQSIIIFIVVGIFILIIAIINFMNLSTARYTRRSLEVGLKKVLGSSRKLLINQFLFESLLVSFIAMIISFILVEIFIGKVNIVTEKELSFHQGANLLLYVLIFLITTITGLLAGMYPALVLSAAKPIQSLKGVFLKGKLGGNFRKFLVILQFTISVALIISSIIISQQLNFIANKDLGMNRKNVYSFNIPREQRGNFEVFKAEIQKSTIIENVSAASAIPFENWSIMRGLKWDDMTDDNAVAMGFIAVTDGFFETMQIDILDGRELSSEYAEDSVNIMFNESAIKLLGWENPIGKVFAIDEENPGRIVGIVNDYHSLPLNMEIEPMVFIYSPGWARRCFVRYQEGKSKEALAHLESVWDQYNPGVPFDHYNLDEYYDRLYTDSQKMAFLISVFTILAIIISCLGLFGLASHSVEQKRREIGIRKAHGASFAKLLNLLTIDFTKWVVFANILAWPIAWNFMDKWLSNFAYHTNIKWYVFVIGFFLSITIALLTTLLHTWKTANTNPAEVLKYE